MNTQLFFIAAMSSALALGCSESAKDDTGAIDEVADPNDDIVASDTGAPDGGTEDGGTEDEGTEDGGSTGGATTSGATDGTGGAVDGAGGAVDGAEPPGSDDGGATDGIGGLGEEGPPIEEGGSSVGGGDDDDGDDDSTATDDGGETGGGETDDGETDDGETDGGEDDAAAGDEGGETGEVPETETDIEDVDTDIVDSTSSGVDRSDCDLYVEFDEDADGELDRVVGVVWDSSENVISEWEGYPTVDEDGDSYLLIGYRDNEYDGDCQTLDAYYIGNIYPWEPDTIYYDYLEEYTFSCDDRGEFAGYEYEFYDNYTDDALADGEADEIVESAIATNTYNDLDQVIAQTVEYYDADGEMYVYRELTQTFDGKELDSYDVKWVATDELYDGLYGDDERFQVDSRDPLTKLPTRARWYDGRGAGDVIQNGEWSYDVDGNMLEGRVWLDGEYDLTEEYEYDADGNQVYHSYFEAVSGYSYEEEWAFDADGNQVSYGIDNPDEDEVYTISSTYDSTEFTRLVGQVYDLDSDEIDDFDQSVVYSGESFPWAYGAELSFTSTGELVSTEKGEYSCGVEDATDEEVTDEEVEDGEEAEGDTE